MNHAQIRAFHAVATEGGFTKAERLLGVSQPAVTIQVRALEEALKQANVAPRLGIGVVTESELGQDDRLATLKISDATLEAREYVVCLKERRSVRTVQAFFDLVDEDQTLCQAARSPSGHIPLRYRPFPLQQDQQSRSRRFG